MERRGLVLSRDQGDGIGKGCQEISPWWVRFFSEINVMFSMSILFYSCYSLNIPSNNSRIRNQDTWLCWFSVIHLTEKKKWILGPLSMCDMSFRKGGVAGLHARGDTKKGEWYSFSNYAGVESGLCNQMRQIVSF